MATSRRRSRSSRWEEIAVKRARITSVSIIPTCYNAAYRSRILYRQALKTKLAYFLTVPWVKAAVKAGAEHRRIMVPTTTPSATKLEPVPTRKRAKGRLGLGHVNAHHEQIKTLINRRCRGVSSPYLESYLGWHRAMMR